MTNALAYYSTELITATIFLVQTKVSISNFKGRGSTLVGYSQPTDSRLGWKLELQKSDKHVSFLLYLINYGRQSFYSTRHGEFLLQSLG